MKEVKRISQLLEQNYGLTPMEITQLDGEQDLNFYIKNTQTEYIAKLMHVGCTVNDIQLQTDTLEHLQSLELGFQTPRIVRSKKDKYFEQIETVEGQRILWVLSYSHGDLYAHVSPRTDSLHASLGTMVANLTNALRNYDHQNKERHHRWMLSEALQSQTSVSFITDECKEICQNVFTKFEHSIIDQLNNLPHSIIHNDLNDYNLLVDCRDAQNVMQGLFDFGDMAFQATICETAIALSYAILGQEDPLAVCRTYLKSYHTITPLLDSELAILFDLIKTRLAVSIAISSKQQVDNPDNTYLTISQTPAKEALITLSAIPDEFALCVFRHACGFPLHAGIASIQSHLKNHTYSEIIHGITFDCLLDLSVGSRMLGADPKNVRYEQLDQLISAAMKKQNTRIAIGRYNEARMIYLGNLFGDSEYSASKRRRIHMGLDVFCEVGTKVHAPYDAVVHKMMYNPTPLDYGQLVILQHRTNDGFSFYTLYGHLSEDTNTLITEGKVLKAGDYFANIGAQGENGNWPPHLHLQVITHLLGFGTDFPGVVYASERAIWKKLCPNPALLIDKGNPEKYDAEIDSEALIERRNDVLGANVRLSYNAPLHLVHGSSCFLYTSAAQGYLDMYNNVAHVGHSHPRVVEAVQNQIGLLNTNTRYLHDNVLRYSEKLLSKFPDQFDVCFIVNSASEANELALRLARVHTGRKDILVNENAYHGHTTTLIDISPYKHNGPGGRGAPDWLHTVDAPDDYRGKYRRVHENCGIKYAQDLKTVAADNTVAAFIAETYQSVGGQLIPPNDYIRLSYQYVSDSGGLNIADEVQTGFGRLGDAWWGFESQNAVPDIVVLGKPIANGMPMGAVVTTKAIADSFNNGMEFFSTFGGNPVSCAAADSLIDIVEEEGLMKNAQELGNVMKSRFLELKEKHKLIGDVRAQGFFLGIELVRDHETLEAADTEARYIVNRLKDNFILAGVDGPLHNVLKFRPIMTVTQKDIEFCCTTLDKIFQENYLR